MNQLMPDFSQDGRSATPGVCAVCNNHERNGRPVLFTTMNVFRMRPEGRIEICAQDVMEMAALFGMRSPEQVAELEAELEESRKAARLYGTKYAASVRRAEASEEELDALREEIAELRGKKK